MGSSVSSTPSLERAIKKKKVQSDSYSDEPRSSQQVVYRKDQPTATPILIHEDSRREIVQQCIAKLMSTFHLYPHSEVIASSATKRFEDMLHWLYKTDKTNRDTCKNLRAWSREKFVEHLRRLYPRLSNAAVKSYLDMIQEIPFQYDLDNPVLELKFQSELSKIVKHYDSLTIAEEAEAVKILLGKINFPNVYNWKTPSVSKAEVFICQFCGKNNHSNADCRTRTSEFTNNQNRPYIGSEAHGRLVKATGDRDWIPNFKELKRLMSKAGQSSGPASSVAKISKPSKDWKSKRTYVSTILPVKLHIATSPNLLRVVLTFVSQEEAKGSINLDVLLDTGCLAGDFVARRVVDRFNIKPVINSAAKLSVCSGLDNTYYDISKSVIISVNYLNERLNNINTFELKLLF